MKLRQLPIKGAYVIEPEPFEDNRGTFYRIFCEDEFKQIGFEKKFVQINHSQTFQKGTVRGMHFQRPPKSEIKIIKCIKGAVFDVIVDLREESSTFLHWHGESLSAENNKMMYVPEGTAHGFQTLENNSELLYFHTEFYTPEYEGGIRYNDPKIKILWPLEVKKISNKDNKHPLI